MARLRRIAIIGGGIGGLSAAYYLHGRDSEGGGERFECTVFDRGTRLGGNACTAYGESVLAPPFGDLGVNDFNRKTYTLMDHILGVLARTEVNGTYPFAVDYANLLDTTCWYTPRGSAEEAVSYTSDDLKAPGTPFLERIARDWHHFAVDGAAEVLNHRSRYRDMTVGEFVRRQGYSREFAVYNLYARINGMYFMDDRHPAEMPILGVMSYYSLQEGMTGGTTPRPDRKYFANGASDWIYRLADYLAWRGVDFRPGTETTVDARGEGATVTWVGDGHRGEEHFDAVILGVPADSVGRVVRDGLPGPVASLLSAFRYYASMALWHDDESVMPPRREDWRTYNIVIYPEEPYLLRPYTINYVCAMHQGRNAAEAPFVSESPYRGVHRDRVRDHAPLGEPDARAPAVAWFRHNMVSVDAMRAQGRLPALQGVNDLYYTGGWTHGAGLHQEIMGVSLDIAKRLRGSYRETDANEDLGHAPEHTPLHLRVAADTHPETVEDLLPAGFADD